MLEVIEKKINVPIIINGGINSYEQINQILQNDNIDAVGVGAFFIYYGPHRTVLISYIPEDKRKEFDGYSQRLDVENAKRFDKNDFLSACKEMGITKDLKGDK